MTNIPLEVNYQLYCRSRYQKPTSGWWTKQEKRQLHCHLMSSNRSVIEVLCLFCGCHRIRYAQEQSTIWWLHPLHDWQKSGNMFFWKKSPSNYIRIVTLWVALVQFPHPRHTQSLLPLSVNRLPPLPVSIVKSLAEDSKLIPSSHVRT